MTAVSLSFAGASDRPVRETGKEAGLILDLQKVSLGTLANVEQRRQYMSTVQLEKQRIQNFTLNVVYDNAYNIYRQGDYQRAAEMSDVILSIDPSMKKAQTLSDTATKMATYGTLSENEILDMKYNEAISLYKQGRLVEAQTKFEEILTLDPSENDARNWIKRIDNEFSKIHTRRGYYAYKQGDYQEALNQWYNVLLIKKEDPDLTAKIAEVENMLKKQESEKAIEKGFDYYSKGRLIDAYNEFTKAQEIAPGEKQTQKFVSQLRDEIGDTYYNAGVKAYNERRYDSAISNWREAEKWGYKKNDISILVKNADNAKINPPPLQQAKKPTARLLNPQDEFRNAEPLDLEEKPLPMIPVRRVQKEIPEVEPKVTPKKEVKKEPKKEVKKEPKKEVKKEPKKEVKKEPKKEVKKEPKKEVKKEPKKEVKKEPKKVVKATPKTAPKTTKVTPKTTAKTAPKTTKKEEPKKATPEKTTPPADSLPVAQATPDTKAEVPVEKEEKEEKPIIAPSTTTSPGVVEEKPAQDTPPSDGEEKDKTPTSNAETPEPKEETPKETVSTDVEGEDFPTQTIVEKAPVRVTESARQESIKHYRYGLAAFSEGNYEKAKEEWQAALNLNPENSDAALGLKRVEEKYSNR